MDEQTIQRKRREQEEQATRERARLLGLPYLDTRDFELIIPLVPDLLTVQEMHENYAVPLQAGGDDSPYRFMVTSQTPRSWLNVMLVRGSM